MAVAEQLKTEELDRFVDTMLALKARRHTPVLSLEETELLTKINQGLDIETQDRYAELISKRQDERLFANEHEELLQLNQQVEALNSQRSLVFIQPKLRILTY